MTKYLLFLLLAFLGTKMIHATPVPIPDEEKKVELVSTPASDDITSMSSTVVELKSVSHATDDSVVPKADAVAVAVVEEMKSK